MGNRQIFAQIGVFALLGLNVGAYYVFWPHKESGNKSEATTVTQEKGKTHLLPTKKDKTAPPIAVRPDEIPTGVLGSAALLNMDKPSMSPPLNVGADETLGKLLEHIKNETAPAPGGSEKRNDAEDRLPRLVLPEEKKPNPSPPSHADLDRKQPSNSGIAVASALTTKVTPSPWLLNMEVVGNQTQLIAKLRQPVFGRPAVEFKILCDRVEMKAPGDVVQALGKVTFAGAGLQGSCQRLTLPLHETQLVFEEQAQIVQDANLGSILRGDRIVWEASTISAETQPLVTPAEFRPTRSIPPFSPALGNPK